MKCRMRLICDCWQYNPEASIPVWVARNFHKLGVGESMQTKSGEVLMPGDWAIYFEGVGVAVMSPQQFKKEMEIVADGG